MPGSEFRLLPLLPVEFDKYRTIQPWKLGKAMTDGWQPVAALNYHRTVKGVSVQETRYLVGSEPKASVTVPVSHRVPLVPVQVPDGPSLGTPELRGGSVAAELRYPQPGDDLEPPPTQDVEAAPAPPEEPLEDDPEVSQIAADMDELMDGTDDGSEDDDE